MYIISLNNILLSDMTQANKKKFLTKIMKLDIFIDILKNDKKKLKLLINNDIIYYETIINENLINQKNLLLEQNLKIINHNNDEMLLLSQKIKDINTNIKLKNDNKLF
jgi:hypothetical protein